LKKKYYNNNNNHLIKRIIHLFLILKYIFSTFGFKTKIYNKKIQVITLKLNQSLTASGEKHQRHQIEPLELIEGKKSRTLRYQR